VRAARARALRAGREKFEVCPKLPTHNKPEESAAVRALSLRAALDYEPQELNFGTSGRRGKVIDLTQLEIYINALAEMEYLQSLDSASGGIVRGEEFFFAYDLRPSSTSFVEEFGGRGEIAQATVVAIGDAGMRAVNLGPIPTPALTYYASSRNKGSIMVTGSHIPFDRNGYKTNSGRGELLKEQEAPINEHVRQVRARLYSQPPEQSLFDRQGMLKAGHQALPEEHGGARLAYIERFTDFFQGLSLGGRRLLVYQHSAVGRDLLQEILARLGADSIPAGRSETFVPIDTENIDAAQLATIQALAEQAATEHGPLYAVVSTDGDSDRPLVLGVNPATGKVHFFGGDLVGMVVAEYLEADAVVVPISCNDAIDRGPLAKVLEPKTRIGSPFVIAGMEAALRKGKQRVCGWEPNGGFLTASGISRNGAVLPALLTRDSVLPILGALFAAAESGLPLEDLFARLPQRFSRAALLKHFPRAAGLAIVARFSPRSNPPQEPELAGIFAQLAKFFTPALGFGVIVHIDWTDGVRVLFDNGEVAHIRPSGNADELRIYAVAGTESRADQIATMAVAEPDGILRRMERALHE
jgi:phosphomannomutase